MLDYQLFSKVLAAQLIPKHSRQLLDQTFTEQELEESQDQYTPAWSPVFYKDDNDILFIDLQLNIECFLS